MPYAFNYTEGGTWTDREGIKRNCKGLNGHGPSTSEMGAGSHYDALDDCCGHMVLHKIVDMGKCTYLAFKHQANPEHHCKAICSRRECF